MPIIQLPTVPTRSDPTSFAARSDALLSALPQFVSEINALQISNNLEATSSRDQAAVSRDKAIAAWGASMAPAETLPAISKTLHIGAVVRALIYDTSKDSDGGAWRKRCMDKSWYSEPICTGKWLGQASSWAAAWAISGAAPGDFYQDTGTGNYFTLTTLNLASPVYRGNTREFPEQVAVIAESNRVIIYDLTQVGTPMWMVFLCVNVGSGAATSGAISMTSTNTISSVAALNGSILVGRSSDTNSVMGINDISFIRDMSRHYGVYFSYQTGGAGGNISGNLAQRNITTAVSLIMQFALPPYGIKDIAVVALTGVPSDSTTGLPTPTIALATAGGVTVIRHDGVIASITGQASGLGVLAVGFTSDGRILTNGNYADSFVTFDIPTTNTTQVFKEVYAGNGLVFGLIGNTSSAFNERAVGSALGLVALKRNPSDYTKSMRACITNAYNSGWQVGDMRAAWLADTVSETLTGTGELITNGTFTTNTSGWTASNATLAVVSGRLQVTKTAAGYASASQAVATIPGKTYQIFWDSIAGTVNGFLGMPGTNFFNMGMGMNTQFVALSTTTLISLFVDFASANGSTALFDNISFRRIDADRSFKNLGLVMSGSLLKAPVATGAQLVAYSGFSTADYLEQVYSSLMDFGTGDFSILGWINIAAMSGAYMGLLNRCLTASGGGLYLQITPSGDLQVHGSASTTFVLLLSSAGTPLGVGVNTLIEVSRFAGVLSIKFNGVSVASVANVTNLTYSGAITRIGNQIVAGGEAFNGSMALWRISATAPSPEQSAHIYRTERALFQPGAQCVIAGGSANVTALTYDDTADIMHVATDYGYRSGFKDLLRVDSEYTALYILSLAANQGSNIVGTSGNALYYQPAMLLRDELRRKEEARKALGKVPVFFDFDAVTGQTAFALPKGYTARAVYSAEALKREGATKTWTRSFDGFAETINFAVAPGAAIWVSIMAIRSN